MTTTSTRLPLPKAASALIADLAEAGYTVTVRRGETYVDVTWQRVSEGGVERYGSATWLKTNTAAVNARLGFVTSYRPGVRFSHADTYHPVRRHESHQTLRAARSAAGLVV